MTGEHIARLRALVARPGTFCINWPISEDPQKVIGELLAEVEALREAAAGRAPQITAVQREAHRRMVEAWDACRARGVSFELRHAVEALDGAVDVAWVAP
jgi:hypothetical protein